MIPSSYLQSKALLKGAVVRSPLEAGVLGVHSTTEEPRAVHAMIRSVVREAGQ